MGRRHKPAFRLTVVDGRATRDGKAIEELGFYEPGHKNPELRYRVDLDRVDHWLSQGAQPSETASDLIKKARAESVPASA
jgi:small subunit ribosomal protein S16